MSVSKNIQLFKAEIRSIRFLFLAILFPVFLLGKEFEVSIGAIFHNDARYLKEWVDYHLRIGVEHFWLYDDCSDDPWQEVLEPYIKKGVVEVFDWSATRKRIGCWPQIQIEAYKNVIERARGETKWLALIDTDEFILVKKKQSLQRCLKKYYEGADAIYVQWLLFGTSGIMTTDSLLKNMTSCARKDHPWNNVGKMIVRPEKAIFEMMWTVHHVPLLPSSKWFNGSGKEVFMANNNMFFTSHQESHIRINHYFFRDEKFFREVKIPRKLKRDMTLEELFQLHEDCKQAKNREILHR